MSSEERRLRVGVLSRAHVHADGYISILSATPGVDVYVADPDGPDGEPDRGPAGLPAGISYLPSYAALFEQAVDAVVITSETKHHLPLVQAAAAAGAAILCEKPLATTAEDAELIAAAVAAAGVPFMIAYPVRFMSASQELLARVEAGQLGQLVAVRGTNNGRLPTHRPWFTDAELSGGGALFDHVVHVADLIDALQPAPPIRVTAVTNKILYPDADAQVETGGLVLIEYAGGVVAAIDCSWSLPEDAPTWGGLTVNVTGTLGDTFVDPFRPRLRGIDAAQGRAIELPYGDSGDPPLLSAFLEMVRTGQPSQPDLGVALRTLSVVLAAEESARTDQPVPIRTFGVDRDTRQQHRQQHRDRWNQSRRESRTRHRELTPRPAAPLRHSTREDRSMPIKRSAVLELARMLAAGGVSSDPLERATTIADVRRLAERRLPKMAFDFIDGGADGEITLRANIDDLAEVTLRPRSLVDVSEPVLSTVVAGETLPVPLLMGPCGSMRLAGGDGELSAVRAAGAAGLTYTISTASSWSIEELAAEASGPMWFQLYMWRSREIVQDLVNRARAAGCTALVITVDVPINGKRVRDQRNGMSIPPKITARNAAGVIRHPAWFLGLLRGPAIGFRNLQGIAEGSSAMSHQAYINTQLANLQASWDDVAWLRRTWTGPLFIKGITTVEDATSAANVGADGIFVSNHGGRQLDGLPSSISALPRIVDALGDRLDIIMDGGIRRGGDVVKALAVGADAVAIGRSWAWGLAAAGQRGVEHVASIYLQEITETLQLLGVPDVNALDRSHVNFPSAWVAGGDRATNAPALEHEPR